MEVTQHVTAAVAQRLAQEYTGLVVRMNSDGKVDQLDATALAPEQRASLALDLRFFAANPSLPLENICSKFESYEPRTESQRTLVEYAKRLLKFDDVARGAGLYMWGEAGIGKSHLAVGLAKVFMEQGLQPHFMIADTFSFGTDLALDAGQVWIIDDLNTGYGLGSRLFKTILRNIHDRGGRLFVTSNKPYDELMRESFVGEGPAERARYEDRTKGLFKILHVTGESWRQENAWYNDDES